MVKRKVLPKNSTTLLKKTIGYLALLLAIYLAYYRGRKEGEAICVDFNVLPIVPDFMTFVACIVLLIIGVKLLSKR